MVTAVQAAMRRREASEARTQRAWRASSTRANEDAASRRLSARLAPALRADPRRPPRAPRARARPSRPPRGRTSCVTTAPEATNASSPISTPGVSTTPPPTRHARRSIAPRSGISAPCRAMVSSLVVVTPGPTNTSSSTIAERRQVHVRLHAHPRAHAHVVVDHAAAADHRALRRSTRARARTTGRPGSSRRRRSRPRTPPRPRTRVDAARPARSEPTPPCAPERARQARALAEHHVILDRAAVADDRAVVHHHVRAERHVRADSARPPQHQAGCGGAGRQRSQPPSSQPHDAVHPRGARHPAQIQHQSRAPGDELVIDARVSGHDQHQVRVRDHVLQGACSRARVAAGWARAGRGS